MSDQPQSRRPDRALRIVTWPLSLALIVATVLLGSTILDHSPGSTHQSREFVHSGSVGEPVDELTFIVTVTDVRGAAALRAGFDDVYTTDGVFVLVRVRIAAKDEAVNLMQVRVVDRAGREFGYSWRATQSLPLGYTFQPGIPVEGDLVFEVPRDAGPGLALELSSDLGLFYFEPVARVELGIDAATVASWVATPTPAEFKVPEVAR